MGMEEGLVARLAADAAVAAIVGAKISWFGRQRNDPPPSLQLTKIAGSRDWSHGGPSGLDEASVQFDCWAATPAASWALARATLAEMEQPATVGGVLFHEGFLDRQRVDEEEALAGGGRLFRVSLDMRFRHEEI